MKRQLDYSAILQCALMDKNYLSSFRLSVVMKEKIDTKALQKAVNDTINRFPLIYCKISKDSFWYYVENLDEFEIEKDSRVLFSSIDYKEVFNKAISILHDYKTISLEVFHSVTDGMGAMTFFKELISHYIDNINEKTNNKVFDIYSEEELNDSYALINPLEYKKTKRFNISKPFQFNNRSNNSTIQVKKYFLNLEEVKTYSRNKKCKINELILAVFYKAIDKMKINNSHNICLLSPINLRKHFNTKTLRNFVLTASVVFKDIHKNLSYEKLFEIIRAQMNKQDSKEYLGYEISKIAKLYKNPIIKISPLWLKSHIIKFIYKFVGEKSCMTVSNLGVIQFDDKLIEQYIEHFEASLSPRYSTPINCAVVSSNNKMVISITHDGLNQKLFESIESELKKLNISYQVAD